MRLQGISRGPFVIAMVFTSTAIAIGVSQYAFGHFIAPLEEEFGWTRTQIGVSLSFLAVGGLAAPLLGKAMDRFGARPILVFSLVLFGISFCLRPWISELWHFYALSLLQFVPFAGLTLLPAGRLVAKWYPRIRGRVMGIATMGNNIGGLIMPVSVAILLTAMSWSQASVVIGFISLAVAVAAYYIVREEPPAADPRPSLAGKEAMGSVASPSPESTKAYPSEDIDHRTEKARVRRSFFAVLNTLVLGAFAYSVFLPHVFPHLTQAGLSKASASFALVVLATCGACGKYLFGWMTERLGAKSMTMVSLIGQAMTGGLIALIPFLVQAGLAGPGTVAVIAGLYGFFMGGFGVLMPLIVQEIFDMKQFGSIMGSMQFGQVISFGLGPIIAGLSYDFQGGYTLAFSLTCGFFVIGALSLLRCKSPQPLPAKGQGL
ncbi:MFS transporter [Thioalkalivibrio sp. HK1]|uniref:MFS transporter n=1 Tax=Thioalkalivibrio sp. HK1 TaxID=1469245 RepID=UPI00046FB3C6|nr:MFS transporter [Thioalkalivibrio sp. HK1]